MRAINWMEAHDKLAGWAQTFGALIAIALPAWQRRQQLNDARIHSLKLKLGLTYLVGIIVGETFTSVATIIEHANLSPSQLQTELLLHQGLRTRIDNMEPRLPSTKHIKALFLARIGLLQFARLISIPYEAHKAVLADVEGVKDLTDLRDELEYRSNLLLRERDQMTHQLLRLQTPVWRRPSLWLDTRVTKKTWMAEVPKPATLRAEWAP